MAPFSFSSGDLVADRRANYAAMLAEGGDLQAAADLMRDALSLAPAWPAGWYRLGELLAAADAAAEAADAWREALRFDPRDRCGAALRLELAGWTHGIGSAPTGFVETLFDQYAGRFDEQLIGKLGYRVPELMDAAIARSGPSRFAHAVDLGCGTGLMGERLRGRVSLLEGMDISNGMLAKAREKGIYDRLARGDLLQLAPGEPVADLVTAADVFIYFGDLAHLMTAAASMLVPGGLLAFSVELHDGPEESMLRESRRYAHSQPYIAAVVAAAGLEMIAATCDVLRLDRGSAVAGLLVVARRPASAVKGVPAMPEEIVLTGDALAA